MIKQAERAETMRRRRKPRWGGVAGRVFVFLPLLLLVLASCGETPATPPDPLAQEGEVAQAAPPDPTQAPRAPVPGGLAGRLLFVRGGNIWVWDNGQPAQLTDGGGYVQPRWSPDGTAIAYLRRGESFVDVWLADGAAQNGRKLTNNQAKGYAPESLDYVANSFLVSGLTWARTAGGGDRIVYSTDRDGTTFSLWLTNGLAGKPAPINGTRALTGHLEGAALSPDGNTVAFTAESIDQKTGAHATQIFVVDLNSGNYRMLTNEVGGAYDPAWSPDGQWLAYAARQGKGETTTLWALKPDGSGRQRLTEGGKDRGAGWSPDGTRLAFARAQGSGFALYSISLDTTSGTINTGKPERIGDFADVDPVSGVSWAR